MFGLPWRFGRHKNRPKMAQKSAENAKKADPGLKNRSKRGRPTRAAAAARAQQQLADAKARLEFQKTKIELAKMQQELRKIRQRGVAETVDPVDIDAYNATLQVLGLEIRPIAQVAESPAQKLVVGLGNTEFGAKLGTALGQFIGRLTATTAGLAGESAPPPPAPPVAAPSMLPSAPPPTPESTPANDSAAAAQTATDPAKLVAELSARAPGEAAGWLWQQPALRAALSTILQVPAPQVPALLQQAAVMQPEWQPLVHYLTEDGVRLRAILDELRTLARS